MGMIFFVPSHTKINTSPTRELVYGVTVFDYNRMTRVASAAESMSRRGKTFNKWLMMLHGSISLLVRSGSRDI